MVSAWKKRKDRNSWMQKVIRGMGEKGINRMERIDIEKWRKKIELKFQAQKKKKH